MTYYLTLDPFDHGIIEAEGEENGDRLIIRHPPGAVVRALIGSRAPTMYAPGAQTVSVITGKGFAWHTTRAEAVARANVMSDVVIAATTRIRDRLAASIEASHPHVREGDPRPANLARAEERLAQLHAITFTPKETP